MKPGGQYRKGRAFEYACMKKLRLHPRVCEVVRTAGSHGPVDIVAFLKGGQVISIQCKAYKPNKEDRWKAEKFSRDSGGTTWLLYPGGVEVWNGGKHVLPHS